MTTLLEAARAVLIRNIQIAGGLVQLCGPDAPDDEWGEMVSREAVVKLALQLRDAGDPLRNAIAEAEKAGPVTGETIRTCIGAENDTCTNQVPGFGCAGHPVEKAGPVTAEEINRCFAETAQEAMSAEGWSTITCRKIAALVAERTAAAVEQARREERERLEEAAYLLECVPYKSTMPQGWWHRRARFLEAIRARGEKP